MFLELHAGGKFGDGGYKVTGGLHGVGASVTNALSRWLEVEVRREGHAWSARFERGRMTQPVTKGRAFKRGEKTGTTVTWLWDDEIFEPGVHYIPSEIERRLREKACLVTRPHVSAADARPGGADLLLQGRHRANRGGVQRGAPADPQDGDPLRLRAAVVLQPLGLINCLVDERPKV